MASMRWVVIAAALVVLTDAANPQRYWHLTAAQKVFYIMSRVPTSERTEFLRYHLHKGHELVEKKEAEDYPQFHVKMSDDDSVLLYEYYSANRQVKDQGVVKVAEGVICWGSNCIDFSDPGIHP